MSFGAGFNTKGRFDLADQAKAAQQVITKTADKIIDSVEKAQEIERAVSESEDNIQQVEKIISRRPIVRPQPQQETTKEEAPAEHAPAAASRAPEQLDVCTVHKHNTTHQEQPTESSGCGNVHVQAAAAAEGR